ncbi:dopamine beta-hydroxylase [Hetaerina americana]|uniref:dopamine beta-hydroxylase n=1 Tax=Hetaerina americana TaxID=62018 RepID=UPI003A7F4F55
MERHVHSPQRGFCRRSAAFPPALSPSPLLLLLLLLFAQGRHALSFFARSPVYQVPLGPSLGVDGGVHGGGMHGGGTDSGAPATSTMYWRVEYGSEGKLYIEVHVPALKPTSWFTVGFSDRGEPAPADYCILWVDWKGRVALSDTWADLDGRLRLDESQDCEDFMFKRQGDSIKFAFKRKFDSCDPRDYVIEDGTTHVVWSTGVGPLFRVPGVDVVGQAEANGMVRVQLLKTLGPRPLRAEDVPATPSEAHTWSLEVRADKVKVPSGETTYWCHVHRLPDQLRDKHHVVQYEPVIQAGNEPLVHHMEVFHCELPQNVEVPSYRGSCSDPQRPELTMPCKRVLAAWAMGAGPFVYPEETGLPIGGEGFNPYVMLEVHYNNPELRDDWVDSSGVRLYVSPKLRRFDGGVLELGLEYTDKMAIPPHQVEFPLSGHCISECTAVAVPPEGIVVFASQLHTHLTGVRVVTRHVRDGRELPEMNRDDHYSTHFQEIRMLKRRVRVLPGDALLTTCWYTTTDRHNVTLGGFSISDEMCVNYVHYYPKISLEVCKSAISEASLKGYFRFLREWNDEPTDEDGKGVSQNYGSVRWLERPLEATLLEKLYEDTTLSMQCNRSDGRRFQGEWEGVPGIKVDTPLPAPIRPCDGKRREEEDAEDGEER